MIFKRPSIKGKIDINTEYGLIFGFEEYYKKRTEWKTFGEIELQRLLLKRVIRNFKRKEIKKSLVSYKILKIKYKKFLKKYYVDIHNNIEKSILCRIMKEKKDIVNFVKYGLKMYSMIWGENERVFLYTIYSYVKKCEILFYEGKLKEKDAENIDKILDIFGEKNSFVFTYSQKKRIIMRKNKNLLEIPTILILSTKKNRQL